MEQITTLIDRAAQSLSEGRLVKLTLAKPRRKTDEQPKAIYFRPVELKDRLMLQLTLRYPTRDETQNLPPTEAWAYLRERLGESYLQADLFTLDEQLTLRLSRKGKATLHRSAARHQRPVQTQHNRQKTHLIPADRPYLRQLGVTTAEGQIRAKSRAKYRQINKFVEIIDSLLREHPLRQGARVVDMGAGSGYLTFALYDHLRQRSARPPSVTGVEIRPELVAKGNELARHMGFDGLRFEEGYIGGYDLKQVDLLIALHACDTATDDALYQGIEAQAEIMVVAPCCQKQVRKSMAVPESMQPLLRHGILLERQAEMLTDALRALLLEYAGYRTKVFEFIALEHTAKNVMITAIRDQPRPEALDEARELMARFGVDRHHLLDLLTT